MPTKDAPDKRLPSPPPETAPLVSKRGLLRRSFLAVSLGAVACTGSNPVPQVPPVLPPQIEPQPPPPQVNLMDMAQPGDAGDGGTRG